MDEELGKFVKHLNSGFDSFPCWNDEAFSELWCRNRLSTRIDSEENMDGVDRFNAALLWSTVEKRQRLLIGMPERLQHRASALLATGLLKAFLDTRGGFTTDSYRQEFSHPMIPKNRRLYNRDVVYFGSRLGIREDLSHVTLSRKPLREFFTVTFSRRDMDAGTTRREELPRLICIYSPLDPVTSLHQANPFLIAVDCGDKPDVPWLPAVLKHARSKQIPLIAWSSNPLSEVHSHFASEGALTFAWPARFLHCYEELESISEDDPARLFALGIRDIHLCPCELTGQDVDDYSEALRHAQQALSRARRMLNGRVSRDAVLMGYRLLRLLERLPVSLSTYEFERSQYWRQPSIGKLCAGFSRFVSAMTSQDISAPLHEALRYLEKGVDWLKNHEPPLWPALVDLCIEDRESGERRILVFANEAHKKMFAHSLLANEGVCEEDLSEMGISITSITEFVRALTEENEGRPGTPLGDSSTSPACSGVPFLIGLPSGYSFRRIAPIIGLAKTEILYYPHQGGYLKWLANQLNIALTPNTSAALMAVEALGGQTEAAAHPSHARQAVKMLTPRPVQGRPRLQKSDVEMEAPLDIGSPADELTRLLAEYDDTDDVQCIAVSSDETDVVEEGDQAPEFADRAVKIKFADGWCILFGVDEMINFVRPDGSIERRYARSARPRDRVLYIHGERQQNLYELLLSRIHNHHSIRAHVEYIQAWQREVQEQISTYLRHGHTIDELHTAMVDRGSTIQTPMAVYFWAKGWVMRPRDPEDLRRLSEILDMPFTAKCYKFIHSAGDRLHGLHIQLSRRLKAWIMKGAAGDHMRDEVIDKEIQLTFGDVQDALKVLAVESCCEVDGLFYADSLGRLERRATNA